MLGRELPELDERERVRIAAVMSCLLSAQAWLRMREEFGVPGTESGPTVAWVLQAIIDAIRRGEYRASRHARRARTSRRWSTSEIAVRLGGRCRSARPCPR